MNAMKSATTADTIARITLSVASCATRRARLTPSAMRKATSRSRDEQPCHRFGGRPRDESQAKRTIILVIPRRRPASQNSTSVLWCPNVDIIEVDAVKPRWCDTDDLMPVRADIDSLSKDVRVA